MRTRTTNTDIRGIMKRHTDGLKVKEISEAMFIAEASIQQVIDVRFPKKETKKKEA